MSAPHIALVSDDLTGALDSAVPFAQAGLRTVVATGLGSLDHALRAGADVVAVSLNSRETDEAAATSRARHAAAALSDVPVLFKKIDSRMKGHVRAEALELATARGLKRMIVCPAIPELGRFVAQGHVSGHGVEAPIPVALPPDAQIKMDFPDALTDVDLDRIIASADGALTVGARGLASALSRRSGLPAKASAALAMLSLPMTLVIGSRDPVTLRQVERLRAEFPDAQWIAAADGELEKPQVFSALVILQIVDGGARLDGATVSARLAKSMASCPLARRGTLLLTGGETAAACLDVMGVGVLQVLGEIQPGLPVSVPLDFPDGPHIVTKSGGFGELDCLADLVRVAMDQSRAA
ncbi:four-carbon acid sugar kinase family protein [Tabrizicola sp.]|uniref:four-carbon acid sugar kinase family protein n=1 Tax=Tabrizicola sp. TaxID=2005166 RepID=UPI00273432F4|nr:four-carbon acid sugar kinase family protein [Tabrizicola sp.]MDP3195645.1 four-carbon acid sugar kinase family protein [Tabrizicola sp.]